MRWLQVLIFGLRPKSGVEEPARAVDGGRHTIADDACVRLGLASGRLDEAAAFWDWARTAAPARCLRPAAAQTMAGVAR